MEEGKHCPLQSVPWDKNGVKAHRALREQPENPLDTLWNREDVRLEKGPRNSVHFQHVSEPDAKARDLRDQVEETFKMVKRLVQDGSASDTFKDQWASSRMQSAHLSQDPIVKHLVALTNMHDEMEKCRAIRGFAAHRRIAKVEDEKLYGDCQTTWSEKAWYIAFPCMLFAFAFMVQSFLLHLTTHFYVVYMLEEKEFQHEGHTRLYDVVGNWFGALAGGKTEGVTTRGKVPIPMVLLDASGAIPLGLCFCAYAYACYRNKFSIGFWNKTFIVASIMAVTKGIFDVVTIMPDSSGWQTCMARLGQDNLDKFHSMDFKDLTDGLPELFKLELLGNSGKRVRYCADMMISGHTYFATLFSVSAYTMTYHATQQPWFATVVGAICVLCVGAEVLMVAAARFHYTVDMLGSIVLVLALFDSTFVEQLASDWSEGYLWREPGAFQPKMSPMTYLYKAWSARGSREQPNRPPIVASRSTMLINMRTVLGRPPWVWKREAEIAASEEGEWKKVLDEMREQQQQQQYNFRDSSCSIDNEQTGFLDCSRKCW